MAKLMVSAPGVLLAVLIAVRSVPAPESAAEVTTMTALLALTDDVTVSTLAIKAVAVNDAFRTRSRVTRALFIPEPPAVPG
jgi:hypothetical protein